MGIWGSYYNIPNAICYLLKGDSAAPSVGGLNPFSAKLKGRAWVDTHSPIKPEFSLYGSLDLGLGFRLV